MIAKDKTLFQRQLADDFSIRSSVGSLAAWVEMRAPTSHPSNGEFVATAEKTA